MSTERITVAPDDGRAPFTVLLSRVTVVGDLLTGIEVDADNNEVVPKGHDERLHMVSASLVTARVPMVEHNLYGHLVERDEPRLNVVGYSYAGGPRTHAVWVGNRFLGYVSGKGRSWAAQYVTDSLVPALHDDCLTHQHKTRTEAVAALSADEKPCTFHGRGFTTTGAWGEWEGVDGAVLICDVHGLLAPGEAYTSDPPPPGLTCDPGR